MSLNAVFQGAPANVPSPGAAAALGLDEVGGALYYTSPQSAGWQPINVATAKGSSLGQTANNANLLTYNVTATGMYRVGYYAISANTPGAGADAAIPGATVTFTDANTGGSAVDTVPATSSTVVAANVVNQGSALVYAKAGTQIVVATTNYVAGSGTALSYNARSRVEYLG